MSIELAELLTKSFSDDIDNKSSSSSGRDVHTSAAYCFCIINTQLVTNTECRLLIPLVSTSLVPYN